MEPILLVGLDEPETSELRRRLDRPILAFESLPRIQVDRGRLLVEHPHRMNQFVPVERVVFHAIFEDDFDFLTALALWSGPCLPGGRGMMDLRHRLPGLVRALAVSRFGEQPRGYADRGTIVTSEGEQVAKWGNWHCGEDKARFSGPWTATEPTLFEQFLPGEAVRIVLVGERAWQVRMAGDGWLKSIHHRDAAFMPIDPELLDESRRLAKQFALETVGVDYMVTPDGSRHLLEVNHVPNVTVLSEVRSSYVDLVVDGAGRDNEDRGVVAVSTLQRLTDRGMIRPPRWLPGNVQYETIMGSVAYGVSSDTSDIDVYGWAIPMKEDIFPHLRGEIIGFGSQAKRFEQYQEHHVEDRDALAGHGRTYDLTIFGIVKFFALAMENNPNIIDSLFTPNTCVLHCTKVGNLVRENRKLFLHKGAWPKFKGYAYSQLHKLAIKQPQGKRAELVEKHGFDTKFAYHVVRLISEVEMILLEGDIDLQRNNEQLKAIRRGEWTEERLRSWFADKESHLERVYAESTLRAIPDEARIKALLIDCLEEHYGSLEGCVVDPDRATVALRNIQAELDRVKDLL